MKDLQKELDICYAWTEGSPTSKDFRVYAVTRDGKTYLMNVDDVYGKREKPSGNTV